MKVQLEIRKSQLFAPPFLNNFNRSPPPNPRRFKPSRQIVEVMLRTAQYA